MFDSFYLLDPSYFFFSQVFAKKLIQIDSKVQYITKPLGPYRLM